MGRDTKISTVLLWGTEAEHNKMCCVLSVLGNFGAKQMQAKECLLLMRSLQEGYEEELE